MSNVHIAIDLGASGGRILSAMESDGAVSLEEVHRFSNGPIAVGKRLYWDVLGLWQHIEEGLSLASDRYGSEIASIGVDSWGVDFVLLDKNDDLVGPAFNYRDPRTAGILPKLFAVLPREQIFSESGLQFLEINSLSQFFSMRLENSPILDIAHRFLMIADFFHWMLCGEQSNEYTNASTTQLLRPKDGTWSTKLLTAFDIPSHLFLEPIQPGTPLGRVRDSVAARTGLKGVQVIAPATHDTGAAVLAVPALDFAPSTPTWCYISSGTWSLMGVELPEPNLSAACMDRNFTNEGGAQGSTRLLKNIAGLWVFQQCREQWLREGIRYGWHQLVEMALSAKPLQSLIDVDDPRFTAPKNMVHAIQSYFQDSGQPVLTDHGAIARCSLESLALRYRVCLGWLEELLDHSIEVIHIVGGGAQNRVLCQMTANACNRVVLAGPVEATAIGNVMTQMLGLNKLESVPDGRLWIRESSPIVRYTPADPSPWDDAFDGFQELIGS